MMNDKGNGCFVGFGDGDRGENGFLEKLDLWNLCFCKVLCERKVKNVLEWVMKWICGCLRCG